jgi:predicted ATP-grasp superfamily ATP-dependent carboligase
VTILILALSGRALAQAARRTGADVIVADLFGDEDTRRLARRYVLPGSLEHGVDGEALLDWVRSLDVPLIGIVYGTGFEASPELLGELARIAPLIGNRPETVAAMKDPDAFATLLKRLGLPHPEIAASPRPGVRWLRKRRGGCGGTHIEVAIPRPTTADPRYYFQVVAPGHAVSALFVADGKAARVLGLSEQWTAPSLGQPFRFGGSAGPLQVAATLAAEIDEACQAITAAAGLVGLNSLDTLVDGERFTVLEVNPRPSGTLDLFLHRADMDLWSYHLRGVQGELPEIALSIAEDARAAVILYADQARAIPASFDWGAGVADIPAPLSRVAAGMPICTVIADGPDTDNARAVAERRAAELLSRLPLLVEQPA